VLIKCLECGHEVSDQARYCRETATKVVGAKLRITAGGN